MNQYEINDIINNHFQYSDDMTDEQRGELLDKTYSCSDELIQYIDSLIPKKKSISEELPPLNTPVWIWSNGSKYAKIAIMEERSNGTYFFSVINGFGIVGMDGYIDIDRVTRWMLINSPEDSSY